MTTASDIADRVAAVRHRIAQAAAAAGRDADSITLLGAAKAQPNEAVRAAIDAGVTVIGENYLDDGVRHQDAAGKLSASWHFIGPVQSNKTSEIAARFDCVQSLDRDKIARRLNDQRPDEMPPLDVLVQVNISGEASKSGLDPEAVQPFCASLSDYPRLRLRGLMAIPAPGDHDAGKRLAASLNQLQAEHPDASIVSIGMSGDLDAAIASGSTLVRIGTDLFGPRPKPTHAKGQHSDP